MRIHFIVNYFLLFVTCIYGENDEIIIPIPRPPGRNLESEIVVVPNINGGFYYANKTEILSKKPELFTFEDVPPTPVSTATIFYHLYTQKNPSEPYYLSSSNNSTLEGSSFDPNKPTRMFIHGWQTDGKLGPVFADAYFKKANKDINFIVVDWHLGSNTWNYEDARMRVFMTGSRVAKFILFLVKEGGLKLHTLEIFGHSLGAHVCGIAGKQVQLFENAGNKISKIIGLDPALPLFSFEERDSRLSDGDADMVEIIHTNAGFFGFEAPIGTVSFYPNGGAIQPGCKMNMACSHSRAHELYAESIYSSVGFYSWQFDSFSQVQLGEIHINSSDDQVQMGADVKHNKTGVYYLQTNESPPFAKGPHTSKNYISFILNKIVGSS